MSEVPFRRAKCCAMSTGSSPATMAFGGFGPRKKSCTRGYAKNSDTGMLSKVRYGRSANETIVSYTPFNFTVAPIIPPSVFGKKVRFCACKTKSRSTGGEDVSPDEDGGGADSSPAKRSRIEICGHIAICDSTSSCSFVFSFFVGGLSAACATDRQTHRVHARRSAGERRPRTGQRREREDVMRRGISASTGCAARVVCDAPGGPPPILRRVVSTSDSSYVRLVVASEGTKNVSFDSPQRDTILFSL